MDNKKNMKDRKIDIIKNAFLSSFYIIEELLNEIEFFLERKERFFMKVKRSGINEEKILSKINEMKTILRKIKEELSIKQEETTDIAIINSRCAKIWEILNDLKSEKLKRYGEIPMKIEIFIEPLIKKLISLTNEIVDLTNKKK